MVNLSIIKDLCRAKGITLTKLASGVGMAQSAISESIKRNTMTLVNLEKIANYFNVSVGCFFGEKYVTDKQYNHLLEIIKSFDTSINKLGTDFNFNIENLKNTLKKIKNYGNQS